MLSLKKILASVQKEPDLNIFREIPLPCRGKLYTSPMPYGAYDKGSRLIDIYRHHHIRHVFMLVTDSELQKKARRDLLTIYTKHNLEICRYPIADYTAPSAQSLQEMVNHALGCLQEGNVAIHCHAGVGRTSVAASCIVRAVLAYSAEEAIAYVKENMTVDMTAEQMNLVGKYENLHVLSG
ncbi:MAG: fused DSP-PTPase phosphatase/NAD kinase-like protein [Candidatus Sumerlaeia bacterium]